MINAFNYEESKIAWQDMGFVTAAPFGGGIPRIIDLLAGDCKRVRDCRSVLYYDGSTYTGGKLQ